MHRIILTSEATDRALADACGVLASGGLVMYPTETIYGIAADAADPNAVTKLLAFKERPAGRAISVLVSSQRDAERLVELNDDAKRLYSTYLPGPLTVVSKDRGAVDPRLASELGTLGIRISSHPVAMALAQRYGRPLTASSANASGAARPYDVDTALSGLNDRQTGLVDLILDAGTLPPHEPSSVIDTTNQVQRLVRAGSESRPFVDDLLTEHPEDTVAFGRRLASAWLHALPYRPLVFALNGPLGAGKTQFAKGLAQALGISEAVTSPSYTLIKEYQAPGIRFIHMDLWRTPGIRPEELELEGYLRPNTVLAIEWANPVLEYLKAKDAAVRYLVDFQAPSEWQRRITMQEL